MYSPDKAYDVIIAGGGTAGSCAAIAAARTGARTLVVEQFGFLGGTQTGALVVPLMPFSTPTEQLITGLNQEIIERCEALGDGNEGVFFNPELLKYVLEQMVLEAGADLLYHTFITGAPVEHGRIRGLDIANKSGAQTLHADIVVDCTGDADVAVAAGVPYESGRPEDGLNQSASLRFTLGNVDWEALAARLRELGNEHVRAPRFGAGIARGSVGAKGFEELLDRAEADGVFAADEGGYIQFFTMPGRPGELGFNCPRLMEINGARAEDLTRAQIRGRQIIPKIIEFCRRYLAGFDHAYLAQTAPLVGIRESRRIIGEYVLTVEDVLSVRKFDDRIAKSRYGVDIHNPTGPGIISRHLPPGEYHDIPYRCLVPLEVDNLLVAGRCVSATFEAQAAIRIEPNCRAMGQAAGLAAALCVSRQVPPRRLDTKLLLDALGAQGANVAPSN